MEKKKAQWKVDFGDYKIYQVKMHKNTWNGMREEMKENIT